MSEQDHFMKIQVTYELRLYWGRLDEPHKQEGNWLLYFKDQFTKAWTDKDGLRPGEYVYIKDVKVLPPE